MRTVSLLRLSAALWCGMAFGQNAEPPAAFEIADVHVSAHSINPSMRGGFMRGGRYELRNATMLDLIRTAYGVDEVNVVGGPSWLEADRFDVIAKAPADATPEALKVMLQSLLADRFKLVVHKDSKPLSAYALTVVKRNPQMKQSDGTGASGCQGQPTDSPIVNNSYSCHNVTMAAFADTLRNIARGYTGSDPVQDMTGLVGGWDFNIKWSGRGVLATAGSDGVSLFDAVEKQLGMKLELRKIPIPVVIVDSVNEKPTDNPAGVTQKLPALPKEFEVAEIKPSLPGTEPNLQMQKGGRIDAKFVSLKDLIMFAWNIDDNEDDMLVGAPKWLDTEHFDIIAKAPPDAGDDMDSEAFQLMTRTLLNDRFKLATHNEERPVTVLALVSAKPKLKAADPANRSSCKVAGVGGGGAAAALFRTFTCQNMSMALFAERLQGIAPAYIDHPVVDATGMDGAWDFTLRFSGRGLFERRGAQAAGGVATSGAPAAQDPNGAISLFEALEKELGLKLETQKRPMPVLVIDHVEQTPTSN